MALEDELKHKAKEIIEALEAGGQGLFTREEVRELPFDLMSMNPSALQRLINAGQYLAAFTAVIHVHRNDLFPWVTVYGGGIGMQLVFNRIIYLWSRSAPTGGAVPAEVQAAIDEDIPRYVKMISS
jgi:hypothetical protein